jgi:hypothetical protein
MAKQPRPTIRHPHAATVRAAVRTQLAHNQRRRQELSQALGTLRRDLRDFRCQVRTRLRQISHEAAKRRTASAKPSTPIQTVAEPVVQPHPAPAPTAAVVTEQKER